VKNILEYSAAYEHRIGNMTATRIWRFNRIWYARG